MIEHRVVQKIEYHFAHLRRLFEEIGADPKDPNFRRFADHMMMARTSFEKYIDARMKHNLEKELQKNRLNRSSHDRNEGA